MYDMVPSIAFTVIIVTVRSCDAGLIIQPPVLRLNRTAFWYCSHDSGYLTWPRGCIVSISAPVAYKLSHTTSMS
ncbi:hypothetical protein M405DRAFT_807332 [Rhizopogon salebrosus TDB-379]|nr:hypothetical protein M405DRAFT_807332 [Rhizopogon salebrosus TDB-379]